MTSVCKKCGVEFEDERQRKYCPECRKKRRKNVGIGVGVVGGLIVAGIIQNGLSDSEDEISSSDYYEDETDYDAANDESVECEPSKRSRKPCDVSMHPRNLPSGRQPSQAKIDAAAALGIELKEGQTWVVAYSKGNKESDAA